VVNFHVPAVPDDYIHRVGRTARAELTGEAFTLVAPEDEASFARIERAIESTIARVRLDGFAYGVSPDETKHASVVQRANATRANEAEHRQRRAAKAARKSPTSAPSSSRPRRRRFGKRR